METKALFTQHCFLFKKNNFSVLSWLFVYMTTTGVFFDIKAFSICDWVEAFFENSSFQRKLLLKWNRTQLLQLLSVNRFSAHVPVYQQQEWWIAESSVGVFQLPHLKPTWHGNIRFNKHSLTLNVQLFHHQHRKILDVSKDCSRVNRADVKVCLSPNKISSQGWQQVRPCSGTTSVTKRVDELGTGTVTLQNLLHSSTQP